MKTLAMIVAVAGLILTANGAVLAVSTPPGGGSPPGGGDPSVGSLLYDQNVTPDVIFGDGNANGAFTVDRNNGVELGLRAKLRFNASGNPENTFNSNGDGSYTFNAGVAPTKPSPTAEWCFEWSINSNYDGTSGYNLDDLTYALTIPTISAFDPINGQNGNGDVLWDHAIGTNSTGNGEGSMATGVTSYATLIGSDNVAQNSWQPGWFQPFDPTAVRTYDFVLTAYAGGTQVASTQMMVDVVPEPATLSLLALGGLALIRRKRKA